MTSYNPVVRRCPFCDAEFHSFEVSSHNTIGAKFYTDGFVDGPMYDEGSELLLCKECDNPFWKEETNRTAKWLTETEYFQMGKKRSQADVINIRGKMYEEMLDRSPWKTGEQEKYVRIRAWWSFNAVYREHPEKVFILSPAQQANLERLLQLMEDADNTDDLVCRAEVLRHLGRFDECIQLLAQLNEPRYARVVSLIRGLAEGKERRVAIIN